MLISEFDSTKFIDGYIEAALWTSGNRPDDPTEADPLIESFLDDGYTRANIDPESIRAIEVDCLDFIFTHRDLLKGLDEAQCGRDFWYTRSGCGISFLDRDLGDVGEQLYEAVDKWNQDDLYLGDDGKIYMMGAQSVLEAKGEKIRAFLEKEGLDQLAETIFPAGSEDAEPEGVRL